VGSTQLRTMRIRIRRREEEKCEVRLNKENRIDECI
jgi:hypothetical protein